MVSPAWREELRKELAGQGLPPTYIERLVQELCDHVNDVMEESESMEAEQGSLAAERVGKPSNLAVAALSEYHKRAFSRNHPVVMFAVLPILLLPVLWVALGAALWLVLFVAGYFIGEAVDDMSPSLQYLRMASYGTTGMILVPPGIIAVIFCRFARCKGIKGRWPMLTTGILAIIAGLIFSTVIPWGPIKEPRLAFCVGLPVTVQQLLQSVLIFAIGGWSCWRGRQTQIVL